jgi:hypothetical protein
LCRRGEERHICVFLEGERRRRDDHSILTEKGKRDRAGSDARAGMDIRRTIINCAI